MIVLVTKAEKESTSAILLEQTMDILVAGLLAEVILVGHYSIARKAEGAAERLIWSLILILLRLALKTLVEVEWVVWGH